MAMEGDMKGRWRFRRGMDGVGEINCTGVSEVSRERMDGFALLTLQDNGFLV